MKKFFFRSLLILIPTFLVLLAIIFRYNDGYVDPFYHRISSGEQKSLIIGTSRAAQGILPEILDQNLGSVHGAPFYNFAFTAAHSPYGPYYNKLIKLKINKHIKNGVFILAVDPWALSVYPNETDIEHFRESNSFIGKLSTASTNPNLEYIFKHSENSFYKLFTNTDKRLFLHYNGWLEISPPSMKKAAIEARVKSKMLDYNNRLKNSRLSEDRLNSLKHLIQYLEKYGTVVLIRIPVSEEMYGVEKKLSPDFDTLMLEIANQNKIQYLNYIAYNSKYQTTDGNHLYKESSKLFSHQLAKDLRNIL